MTSRRQFLITGALGALGIFTARAQPRPVTVGILLARPLNESFYAPAVVRRLGELGYREGTTLTLEHRSADGVVDRFPSLARELADAKCDLAFAIGPEHAVIALQRTRVFFPIVFLAVDYDPLERGVVTSLGQPDRNTTGVYIPQGQLGAKRLEILREIVPQARRFLVLSDAFCRDQLPPVRRAAAAANVELTVIELRNPPYNFRTAFESARQAGVGGYISLASPVFATQAEDLGAELARHKLPSAGWTTEMQRIGFVVGYSEDRVKASRRTADMGLRILKGARPSEIPVEQADEFEFVINANAARTLGLKIPESVLARATRIVQ
jgi:putative ABC transport system substrate-binding protein